MVTHFEPRKRLEVNSNIMSMKGACFKGGLNTHTQCHIRSVTLTYLLMNGSTRDHMSDVTATGVSSTPVSL